MSFPETWLPKKDPWLPPDYDDVVVLSVRALANGTANEHQQKVAWRWMMYLTAATEEFADLSYRPGELGRRDTDFAEGKKFIGLMIRKMLNPALTPKNPIEPDKQKRKPRTARTPKNAD
jgi:hypothetical protein